MKMRRVAIYKNRILPISETFIAEQARGLSKWNPMLVGQSHVPDGLDVSDLGVRLLANQPQSLVGRVVGKLARLGGFALPSNVKQLKALNAGLVHVHFGNVATEIWPAVRRVGLPMLVTLHGHDINKHDWWWKQQPLRSEARFYPQRLRKMAQHPRVHFVAVSEAIKQQAVAYGIPADKITVSYIGVDTQRFQPQGQPITQRNKRVFFVGRMVEKKAPQLLVRAFAEVRKTVPDAELVMIGDGPLMEDTRALASQLGAPVEFLGACPHSEVQQQLHQSRVLCLPSVTAESGDAEGLGMVILEAQASGVPVVTSARGGATEGIIDGKTGIAFAEGDVAAMIKGLSRLLQDDEFASAASTSAVAHVQKHFDIRTCTGRLEKIYTAMTQKDLDRNQEADFL